MKTRLGFIVAVFALVGAQASGHASHLPGSVQFVALDVVEGDTISFRCNEGIQGIVFEAQTFSVNDETHWTGFGFTNNGQGTYVDVKAGVAGAFVPLADPTFDAGWINGGDWSYTFEDSGRYRYAWGSWGGDVIECTAALNGNAITVGAAAGSYLQSSDFTAGAGISSVVSVAPLLAYVHDVDGYQFTWLPSLTAASISVDPEGEISGSPISGIASPKDGTWVHLVSGVELGGVWGATIVIPD